MVAAFSASLLLFVAACLVPTMEFTAEGGETVVWRGWKPLAWGCFGMIMGQTAWMANLALFSSWGFWYLGRPAGACTFGAIALALAATSVLLFGQQIPNDRDQKSRMKLRKFRPGFYLWIGSMAIVAAGAAWQWYSHRDLPPPAGG